MSGLSIRLPQDDRLVRLAAMGDRNAFASIYERHHQGLYRYCRSILGNDEDAADALQNTMASAMQGLSGERREVTLKPWLYRVAHNESISMLRRRRPHAGIEVAEAAAGPALEGTAESRERLRQLVADLGELPERQRGLLLMRELSGLSYDEAAAALEISPAAAKQGVFEARTALNDFSEGRAMACESVRRSISDRDGRVMRGRRLRAHLRDCAGCRGFRDEIASRGADLQALAPPLPAVLAGGLLERLLRDGGGDGPGGGLGSPEAGAEAVLGQAAAVGSSGAAAAGSGGWIGGLLGASAAAKGVAAVAATLAVGTGAAGLTIASSDRPASATQASGQEPSDRPSEAERGDHATGEGRPHDEREAGGRDAGPDGRRGGDERVAGAAPDGGTRAAGEIPASERIKRPDGVPVRDGGDRPAGTGRPDGAAPPSGDGLPEPAEQQAGGRVPERGSPAPGSQAPAGAPDAGTTLPSLPDRAGSAPGTDAPALPDIAPDADIPSRR